VKILVLLNHLDMFSFLFMPLFYGGNENNSCNFKSYYFMSHIKLCLMYLTSFNKLIISVNRALN